MDNATKGGKADSQPGHDHSPNDNQAETHTSTIGDLASSGGVEPTANNPVADARPGAPVEPRGSVASDVGDDQKLKLEDEGGDTSVAALAELGLNLLNDSAQAPPVDTPAPSAPSSPSDIDDLIIIPVAEEQQETAWPHGLSANADQADLDHDRQSPSLVTPSSTSEEPTSSREPSSSDSTTSSDCSPPARSMATKRLEIDYTNVTLSPPTASAQVLSLVSSPPMASIEQATMTVGRRDGQAQDHHLLRLEPALATQMLEDRLFDSESELIDAEIDTEDLKDYYTDCSDDTDAYFGFNAPSKPNSNRSSVSPAPPSPPRAGGSRMRPRSPILPTDAPVSPHMLAHRVSVGLQGDSPTRAGKRRALSPHVTSSKRRKSRMVFAPSAEALDIIVTELLLATFRCYSHLPSAVEARHGGEDKGRYRFYQFLFECRRVLDFKMISLDWYYAVKRNPLWLDIPSALVHYPILRSLANPTIAQGYERIDSLGWLVFWLRERCLACLLNGVNLDIRGIKRGLAVLRHHIFGPIMLCNFHSQSFAEAKRSGNKDIICHACLMDGCRPEHEHPGQACIIPAPRGPECRGWRANECGDCRSDAFVRKYEKISDEIPEDYHDCYMETKTYDAWVTYGWGKSVDRVLNVVMEEVEQMIQRDACKCGICERQKRLREEEAEGAFGAAGRNGAGADKRIKRC